jgi:ABC-type antimicrobial peptide transport system permease subunit
MTGRAVLIARLAGRDLLRRKAESVLLLIVIAAATATLALGLDLSSVTHHPYAATKAQTDGPDVSVQSMGAAPGGGAPGVLTALERAPGVTAFGGPYQVVAPRLRAAGRSVPPRAFFAVGRDQGQAAIDQPKLTQGSWVRPGGVVIEPTYAKELNVRVGSRIWLDSRPFKVVGIAVTAAWPAVNSPGLMWLTTADARSLITKPDSVAYWLNLKLANPASATTFADARNAVRGLSASSSQEISEDDAKQLRIEQGVLVLGSWMLTVLAIASVTVLVGVRMAEQNRRVGLIKAFGGTPKLVATVLLAEHVALALVAGAAGLGLGWLATPLLAKPVDGLIGAPSAAAITPVTVGIVLTAALLVAVLATFLPSIRAARMSTVAALADAPKLARRSAWLISISRRLPVSLLIGLWVDGSHPRRLVLNVISTMITVALLVAAITLYKASHMSETPDGLINPIQAQIVVVVNVIAGVLMLLAAVNAAFVAWTTAIDSRRPLAIARSLGATQEQVTAGLLVAQMLSGVVGALLGVPAGLWLVATFNNSPQPAPTPSPLALAAITLGTTLAIAGLASVPARIIARRPTAAILQAD